MPDYLKKSLNQLLLKAWALICLLESGKRVCFFVLIYLQFFIIKPAMVIGIDNSSITPLCLLGDPHAIVFVDMSMDKEFGLILVH